MSEKKTIKGNISIHTENIFPIIKKWLYSDHDIFLRELISNSFDAITKLKKLTLTESLKDIPSPKIDIQIDKDKKTITISDTGLGMSAKEVQKYINQIAFSGAEDFLKKFKDKEDKQDIIGHFGLGFYSSFMVADTVEIKTKSYQSKTPAVHWTCTGNDEFEITSIKKESIGTDVILNINDENKDFLEDIRIETLIKKYANFLPVPISLNGTVINDQNGLWAKSPQEAKDEEYTEFYQKLFPYSPDPLFWVHLNVDYPFRLQGILYFPKLKQEADLQKGRIKLFCQQVFVTDNAGDILPDFLMLLQGAIDCPEFPLNVSRSALQNDPYVQKISRHIIKKVADKLLETFKKDRQKYEGYWEELNTLVKYGMMNDTDFYDKTKDALIFKTTDNSFNTLEEYLSDQKDKEKTVLYTNNQSAQATYITMLKKQGKKVLLLDTLIDSHFLQFLEMKNTDIKFNAIDSGGLDHLIDEKDNSSSEESKENNTKESEKIVSIFKSSLNNDKLNIEVKRFISNDTAAIISEEEFAKRMKDMSHLMMPNSNPDLLSEYKLTINSAHPTIKNILDLSKKNNRKESISLLCHYIYDLALLSHGSLDAEKLPDFIQRSQELLEKASHG